MFRLGRREFAAEGGEGDAEDFGGAGAVVFGAAHGEVQQFVFGGGEDEVAEVAAVSAVQLAPVRVEFVGDAGAQFGAKGGSVRGAFHGGGNGWEWVGFSLSEKIGEGDYNAAGEVWGVFLEKNFGGIPTGRFGLVRGAGIISGKC